MNKFKSGDKVAFYNNGVRGVGIVTDTYCNLVQIAMNDFMGSYHYRQVWLRRFKPKKPKREFWIGGSTVYYVKASALLYYPELSLIHVREV